MKPLIVIPARGGSKGVPRKNIKLLNGKPLIHYTVEAARAVFNDSIIYVSTDDSEIKNYVESLGLFVPFLRPESLATDSAGSREVLLHAVMFAESNGYAADTVILLQPTSPFRNATHLKEALLLYGDDCDMVASVKETASNPYFVLFEDDDNGYLVKSKVGTFSRRQDCPKVWEFNGAIYIIHVAALKEKPLSQFTRIRKFEMDEISSHDIDTPFDWMVAECIASQNVAS